METVVTMPRIQLGQLCRGYGSALELVGTTGPDGKSLDGARLLWALAGRESSFGGNMVPRHEPSWDVGGGLYHGSPPLQAYIAKYGKAGACSYGPLQAMAFNLQPYTPAQLAADPATAFAASIKFFNRYVIENWKDKTLLDVCDTWNAGNPRASALPGYYPLVLRYYTGGAIP